MLKSDFQAAQAGVRISSPPFLVFGVAVDHGKHKTCARMYWLKESLLRDSCNACLKTTGR